MGNPFLSTLDHFTPVTRSSRLEQVENNTGGFVFVLDAWKRLERFLILGTDGGTYYATEAALTLDNLKVVQECLGLDGPRTVRVIVDVSTAGRAPRNSAAIFALVMALKKGDSAARTLAAQALPAVCRTGTHLLEAASYVKLLGGWGRQTRRAFANWYTGKDPKELVYQLIKYQQREGWAQRDVLRLAHPDPRALGAVHQAALRWAVKGTLGEAAPNGLWQITGFEAAKRSESPAQTANLIREYQLPRECVKSEHLTSAEVWEALLYTGMPLHALMRNLPTMTRVGLLRPMGDHVNEVRRRLADVAALRRSRLHPMSILIALVTYRMGHSVKGSNTWTPVPEICTILDDAFYAAFGNVESTGKRIMLALDVSGSMGVQCAGLGISAREASAAMAMVTMAREPRHYVVEFQEHLTPSNIHHKMRLPDVIDYMARRPFGSTRCSAPFEYALQNRLEVDAFVVFTDNETNIGIHPFAAMQRYRREMGIPAKLIVNGMTSTGFTIAKPDDPGMLDLVGLDANMPALMSDFIRG